jgi:hypothetical protein
MPDNMNTNLDMAQRTLQANMNGSMAKQPSIGSPVIHFAGAPQQPIYANPLDMVLAEAKKTTKTDISLKDLKQWQKDKIVLAIKQCREVANNYYSSVVEPKTLARENIYKASADHYKEKFATLSEYTNWCSRDIRTTIDWLLPTLIETYTGSDDPIDFKGVNIEDDEVAKKMQLLIKYQLERKNSYFVFLLSTLKDALKLNMGACKVYWKRDEKHEEYEMMLSVNDFEKLMALNAEQAKGNIIIKDMEPIKDTEDLYKVVFDKVTKVANHPVLEYLPTSELRFTPEANTLQDCKYVAHRKIVRGDYLKRKEQEGVYENVDEALEECGNVNYTNIDIKRNPELRNANNKLSDQDKASKQVELYEVYIKVDYNNDGIYEYLIVHMVGDVILRVQLNDFEFAPFFNAVSEYDPNVIFSDDSFLDNIEQLQDLKTALIRQIIINVAKNNAPQKFINERNVDMDALISGEENIPVDGDVGASVFVPPSLPLSGATMELVQYAQVEIEEQTGSNRYNHGGNSPTLNKTATGVTALLGQSSKRMNLLAKQIAENFIVPVIRFLILLNQKYLDDEQMVRLTNENVTIKREELDIDYDLIINIGQGAGTREAQIQCIMLLINQIYPQLAQMGVVDENSWYNVTKELLEKMGIRNITNYLLDPKSDAAQQRKAEMQQQMQQQQQMQLELAKAKADLELEKARIPRLSVNYEDLPVDVQQKLLQTNGLTTSTEALAEKELIKHV